MRVAMVSLEEQPASTPVGGACRGQSYLADVPRALAELGHRVTVYTLDRPDPVPDGGVDVVPVGPGPLPHNGFRPSAAVVAALRERWREDGVEIVHAHSWPSGLTAITAAEELPVVQTFHSLGPHGEHPRDPASSTRLTAERLLSRKVAHVLADSADQLGALIRLGGNRADMSVVPQGVDVEVFTPAGRADRKHVPHRIAVVGPLCPEEGLDVPIGLLRVLPDTELVVVGGPAPGAEAEVERLRQVVRSHGMTGRVHLATDVPRSALAALLRSCDVVVCTPREAPAGTGALEAMACGVPVVGFAQGTLTDLVVNGVTGVLVPPQDVRALARALRALLSDATRRDAYGIAGTDRARVRYGLDRIAAETTQVYERVTNHSAVDAFDLTPAADVTPG
ncbi:glycosyltransferase [Saccharothrix obliqua]|uniref:glycosyltransferase n=1 Tax=Saccharothrix obliqua TaxID=2861747 RepID=UPI001C5DE36A|nr:glycosyltransferase [Saccharothrix obliqua]MBW4720463.1 glycosyltransferase [Saccharothrix obliqua]